MLSEPRSIALVLDCIHPQVQHSPIGLQSFFSKQSAITELGYANYNTGPFGTQMTSVYGPASLPGSVAHSAFTIANDRFQIKEEWPRIGLDDFVSRSLRGAELAFETLSLPPLVAVQCTIRALATLPGQVDSRAILDRRFFGLGLGQQAVLDRQPGLLGLRLAFPATETDPGVHNLRIESFNGDPRSLFFEEIGVWTRAVTATDLAPIECAIRDSYAFLTDGGVVWISDRLAANDD